MLSRFVGIGAGAALAPLARAWRAVLPEQGPGSFPRRTLWPLDVDGDGRIGLADLQRVERALESRRSESLMPSSSWDGAADVLGEGRVTAAAARAVSRFLGQQVPARPPVACWHYGWYPKPRRGRQPVTMRYRGGPYASSDSGVEAEFNELKAEFGIDADLLSWIGEGSALHAYERGYLRARNVERRRVGLLYESNINLGQVERLDFSPAKAHAERLIADFDRMGQWLRQASDRARLFAIEDRPVVYVFGSHTYGTTWDNLPHVGRTLAAARAAFTRSFGEQPYLLGDEALFPVDTEAGRDRLYRAEHFDAVARYHHYDERAVRHLGKGEDIGLDARYLATMSDLERRTMSGFAGVRNHYTGDRVAVVPSSAAGFAKRGLPRVRASGAQYRDLLLQSLGLSQEDAARRGADAVPVVLAGSWNEEYEGHGLMPARDNEAMHPVREGGFDWLYALKSVYGPVRGARS